MKICLKKAFLLLHYLLPLWSGESATLGSCGSLPACDQPNQKVFWQIRGERH